MANDDSDDRAPLLAAWRRLTLAEAVDHIESLIEPCVYVRGNRCNHGAGACPHREAEAWLAKHGPVLAEIRKLGL